MTMVLGGSEGSASRPGHSLPPGKTWYPLYRRLGGPQGRSGQVQKISPPPWFDPLTVQPIASNYSDYATRPTILLWDFAVIQCMVVTWLMTLMGGGRANRLWVLGTLIYEGVKLERWDDLCEPVLNNQTPLFPLSLKLFLFAPLQLSSQ